MSATCIQATLFVFIWTAIIIFQELGSQMQELCCQNNCMDSTRLCEKLERWRRHHDISCFFVERVNRCFGTCLLFSLIYANVTTIKYSCQAITSYQNGNTSRIGPYLLEIVIAFSRMFMIVYAAQKMKIEVTASLIRTKYLL